MTDQHEAALRPMSLVTAGGSFAPRKSAQLRVAAGGSLAPRESAQLRVAAGGSFAPRKSACRLMAALRLRFQTQGWSLQPRSNTITSPHRLRRTQRRMVGTSACSRG